MHLFNRKGMIQKYLCVEDILNDFYPVRREMYAKRKSYQLRQMEQKLARLANKATFLELVSSGTIQLVGRSKSDLEKDLLEHSFLPEEREGERKEGDGDGDGDGDEEDLMVRGAANFDYLLRTPLSHG